VSSNVRHVIGFGRNTGKVAVIAGAAAALLCTGTATAANMTPTYSPAAVHNSSEFHRSDSKPRPGSGRDPVQHGPVRKNAPGLLVPSRPSLHHAATAL
jgi:hypothetical protein